MICAECLFMVVDEKYHVECQKAIWKRVCEEFTKVRVKSQSQDMNRHFC